MNKLIRENKHLFDLLVLLIDWFLFLIDCNRTMNDIDWLIETNIWLISVVLFPKWGCLSVGYTGLPSQLQQLRVLEANL